MNIGKGVKLVSWKETTHGSHVADPGNAKTFKTGDWRVVKPVWIEEKCTQCMLCFPVCPDSAIPVNAEGKIEGFDFDFCKGCLACMEVCPFKAIEKEDE
jgi:pyruvate ferredoxin oxidoreductase delta subunit